MTSDPSHLTDTELVIQSAHPALDLDDRLRRTDLDPPRTIRCARFATRSAKTGSSSLGSAAVRRADGRACGPPRYRGRAAPSTAGLRRDTRGGAQGVSRAGTDEEAPKRSAAASRNGNAYSISGWRSLLLTRGIHFGNSATVMRRKASPVGLAVAVVLTACASDRLAGPEAVRIPAPVLRALEATGVENGSVVLVAVSDNHGQQRAVAGISEARIQGRGLKAAQAGMEVIFHIHPNGGTRERLSGYEVRNAKTSQAVGYNRNGRGHRRPSQR